jgi:hypothetical protein
MVFRELVLFEELVVSEREKVSRQEKRWEEEGLYAHYIRELRVPCVAAVSCERKCRRAG